MSDDMMATIARLRSRDPEVENEALRARVVQLEAALEPFARNVKATFLREALGHVEREHLLAARAALKDAPK